MKELTKFLIYALVGVLLCLNVYQCHRGRQTPTAGVYTDTLTVYDTIPYYKPVPRDSVVVRYVTEKLPAVPKNRDSVGFFGKTEQKPSKTVPKSTDLVKNDSVEVQIPITKTTYETDTYRAVISGYRATLDTLLFFQPTKVIQVRQKPKRWSIGILAGYGVTMTQQPKFAPYIGVGVSYNLFSF